MHSNPALLWTNPLFSTPKSSLASIQQPFVHLPQIFLDVSCTNGEGCFTLSRVKLLFVGMANFVFGINMFDFNLWVQVDSVRKPNKRDFLGSGNVFYCRISMVLTIVSLSLKCVMKRQTEKVWRVCRFWSSQCVFLIVRFSHKCFWSDLVLGNECSTSKNAQDSSRDWFRIYSLQLNRSLEINAIESAEPRFPHVNDVCDHPCDECQEIKRAERLSQALVLFATARKVVYGPKTNCGQIEALEYFWEHIRDTLPSTLSFSFLKLWLSRKEVDSLYICSVCLFANSHYLSTHFRTCFSMSYDHATDFLSETSLTQAIFQCPSTNAWFEQFSVLLFVWGGCALAGSQLGVRARVLVRDVACQALVWLTEVGNGSCHVDELKWLWAVHGVRVNVWGQEHCSHAGNCTGLPSNTCYFSTGNIDFILLQLLTTAPVSIYPSLASTFRIRSFWSELLFTIVFNFRHLGIDIFWWISISCNPNAVLSCSDSRVPNLCRLFQNILYRIPEHCRREEGQRIDKRDPMLYRERQ